MNPETRGWRLLRHSHPTDPVTGLTNNADHFPSGGAADFSIVLRDAYRADGSHQMATSYIDVISPDGRHVSPLALILIRLGRTRYICHTLYRRLRVNY